MRRREVLVFFSGAAVAWALAAVAQEPQVARIGFLGLAPASASANRVEALRAGLRDLGWVEGKNIEFEFRCAQKVRDLPELTAGLVEMKVEIIFAPSSTFVEPARRAIRSAPLCSRSMPIPLASGMSPVSRGPAAISPG